MNLSTSDWDVPVWLPTIQIKFKFLTSELRTGYRGSHRCVCDPEKTNISLDFHPHVSRTGKSQTQECSKEWGIYPHTTTTSPLEGLNMESKNFAWFSKYSHYSADSPHWKPRCYHIPANLQSLWDYISCPSLCELTTAISQFWDSHQDKILLSFSNITSSPSQIPKSFIRLLELQPVISKCPVWPISDFSSTFLL